MYLFGHGDETSVGHVAIGGEGEGAGTFKALDWVSLYEGGLLNKANIFLNYSPTGGGNKTCTFGED